MRRLVIGGRSVLLILAVAAIARGQPVIQFDRADDAVVRRTDVGDDGPLAPSNTRLPDLIETRQGKFAPTSPNVNLFVGNWSSSGGFVRIELVFKGVVNPPGTLGYDDDFPVYDPFKYGDNPVFGWVEFDIDADENTGGELEFPEFRYVGAVARFGGKPTTSACANRVADNYWAFDGNVDSPPWVERGGEEFHIAFRGEDIEQISANGGAWCGNPGDFGPGDDWEIQGPLWHRAHGFEDFAFLCFIKKGRYKPPVRLKFKHDIVTDLTTVSLVYPLTNTAAGSTYSPPQSPQPNDGCTFNQTSIEEGLFDLKFSATNATPYSRSLPEFVLIGGWEFKNVAAQLNPNNWRICALVGTAYEMPKPDGASYIWSDILPDIRTGDFNGDGQAEGSDVGALTSFIALHDGEVGFDSDGSGSNQSISLVDCAANFSIFDADGNGIVNSLDAVVAGDMDLNQVVNTADISPFVQALLDPAGYAGSYPGVNPILRGDLSGDGRLDGRDAQGLTRKIMGPLPIHILKPDGKGG